VAVEIVDAKSRIRSFLEAIAPMMGSSLITLEKGQMLRYGDPFSRSPHAAKASAIADFALAWSGKRAAARDRDAGDDRCDRVRGRSGDGPGAVGCRLAAR
jgi:hypothetical protein